MREFDLNIEKVLENWNIADALREIISNALDEQILTRSKDIKIFYDNLGLLHIRDYGRGLKYIHLTQNENEEKLQHPNLIGKFGVGLKDALATFDRNNKNIRIISKYGQITMGKSHKHGFDDILTLHAYIEEPSDKNFIGTEFIISDCDQNDVNKTKNMFLKFSSSEMLEITQYGEIFEKSGDIANIYINGVKVAQEDNFLFSYNITSLNAAIKKALNRERTNVGRVAYSDRIKSILLNVEEEGVIEKLVSDLNQYSSGLISDELKWSDVSAYAVRKMSSRKHVIFMTPKQVESTPPDQIDIVKNSLRDIVYIPETVMEKVVDMIDDNEEEITTFDTVIEEFKDSFEYVFIDYKNLSPKEKDIFDLTKYICKIYGAEYLSDKVCVSETINPDNFISETVGAWDSSIGKIIIKRCQLEATHKYLGTLMHELIHAHKDYRDVSRDFETELTAIVGILLSGICSNKLFFDDNKIELDIYSTYDEDLT